MATTFDPGSPNWLQQMNTVVYGPAASVAASKQVPAGWRAPMRLPEVTASGGVLTPTQPEPPLLSEPIWQRSDCGCRGGVWVEDVPGDPVSGHCNAGTPTGKMFDMKTRGCVPIQNYSAPVIPDTFCTHKGVNYCLYGGIAVAVLALLVLAAKD